jgi:intracellular sulfur oxidation DsrE/DsrF family protein
VEFENFAALRMDLVDLLDSVDVVDAGVYANFV